MNYLQLNNIGKFDKEEKLLAEYFGEGNYTPFYKKHLLQNKINLVKGDFVAGEIQSIYCAFKKLGIDYSHNDYPIALQKYLHRRIWYSTLGHIKDLTFNEELPDSIFVKPAEKLKVFTGFVLESMADWYQTNGAGDSIKVSCSEIVNFLSEYRCPVINGEVRGMFHYWGNPEKVISKTIVQEMADEWKDSPKAYVLDVGVLSTGETALIEVNDAFSLGSYTMDKALYGELLTTRWNELKQGK